MIHAAPAAGFIAVFERYLQWLVRRSFRGVWLRADARLPPGGFVAAANHTSWWDGFVPFLAQRRIARATPFAVMMDESQLRRFPFFRLGGAFSVDPSRPRDAYASVQYAASLARSGAGVWIFPEGRIAPPGSRRRFTYGYLHAAREACVPIVPVALRYTMLDAQRPDAFIEFGEPCDPAAAGVEERVPERIDSLLLQLNEALARGDARAARTRLFPPGRGIDDAVAGILSAVRRA